MASAETPAISIVLGFFLSYLALGAAGSYANQDKASESVVVVGKVFCDTCLEHTLSENGYVISGASIAVECSSLSRKTMTLSIIGETDENGQFKVELPSSIPQSAVQLNKCWVRPLNSPYKSCKIPSKSAPSKLTLQSDSNGVLMYSAGSFSYRHETVPPSCYSDDFLRLMKGRAMAEDAEQSSKAVQQTPTIPSLPKIPPISLPSIPPLPKFSIPPLPQTPQLPTSIPPLPTARPLPKSIPPLPKFSIPPLPQTPQLPASIPPLPTAPPLPKIPSLPTVPPLPKLPPLSPVSVPPLPKLPPLSPFSFPPLPKSTIPNFQVPPIPFLTPPPPGH